ncbi:MAG: hypothetical protein IKQ46_14850 [Bacteroidales bacterium]|nr:hypothetical protein [Bacteroidales bacterium]
MKYQANSIKKKNTKSESKSVKNSKKQSVTTLDSFENYFQKRSKFFHYGITALAFLMSIILFNPDVSVGGDDSTYIEQSYKFAEGLAFPDWHGPFYPIFLSFFYHLSGLNIILYKMLSVLMFTGSVFFTYKIFAKCANYFTATCVSFLSAISLMLLNYASSTYTEPMFMFLQALLLYWVIRIDFNNEDLLWAEDRKKYWKNVLLNYSVIAFLAYVLYQTRTLAIIAIPSVLLLLLVYKRFKTAGVFIGFTVVLHIINSIYRNLVWHTSSVSFMAQLDANFLVNPYKENLGYETLGGFVTRFWDNCALYLSKHLMKLFGLKDYDGKTYSYFVAGIIIVLFLLAVIWCWKRNKKVLIIGLYVLFMVGTTFIMLQKIWDQERLIMIYFPLILGVAIYAMSTYFDGKSSFVPVLVAGVLTFTIGSQTLKSGRWNISDNFDTGSYSSYTDDWRNYMSASKWAAENLPEGSVIACRKSQMSWMAAEATKRVKFHGIYKLYSNDPDSMRSYMLDTIHATHVIMGNLRLNPYVLDGRTITTIRYSLRSITAKYPYSLRLVKQFGTREPAYLFEFVDYSKVEIEKLQCAVIVEPKNYNAWEQMAVCDISNKNYDRVLTTMDEALKFIPNNSKLMSYEGIACNMKGDYVTALAKFDLALKYDPKDASVMVNKAANLYDMKRYDEAYSVLQQAKNLGVSATEIAALENAILRKK